MVFRVIRLVLGETEHVGKRDLVAFAAPTVMYLFGGQTLGQTILLWLYIVCVGSLQFTFVGVNAAHQRPDVFHDGDTPR